MRLVNTTPVPAKLMTAQLFGATHRIGMVVAKATFHIGPRGTELDTQDPWPLLDEDRATELGIAPRDDLPRRDDAFEVVLLGAAHAPHGRPVERMTVSLAVGGERRELLISGDRVWEGGDRPRIGAPVPFTRMPLTHERAFGGTVEVEIDREAFVAATDARNPGGRGFDPAPAVASLVEMLKPPPGYPRYDAVRRLPNIEDPVARISLPEDAPDPVYWGAVPVDSGIQAARTVTPPPPEAAPGLPELGDGAYHRAHPQWLIALPAARSQVTMTGLTPRPEPLSFALPAVRVLVDYVSGLRTGTRELRPHALVLLPEERRFYLVFRHAFTYEYPSAERSMRLRVERGGWYEPPGRGG
ncbi:DUF2169 family type VI secretion system accessory protein [Sorangium sp. So ce513]|uniref:DUF2169 family type VI secretion system accessory protein n=1 Tax=Sorangium sp. So ce513 TaxID=3133315 RepID=UPI003F608C2F